MREWRKTHSMTVDQHKKSMCRHQSRMLEVRGVLKKLPCQFCGKDDSERHHPNHDKPFIVIYLCSDHHIAYHQGLIDISHLVPQTPIFKSKRENFKKYQEHLKNS
jgi:hypothetical protein